MPVSSFGYVIRRVGDPADQIRQARRLPYVTQSLPSLVEAACASSDWGEDIAFVSLNFEF